MTTINAQHIFPRDTLQSLSSSSMMFHVCYALVPGIFLQCIFWGFGPILQILLATFAAIICEFVFARLRKRPLRALDISTGLVTALLLAVSIPATAPWWLIITGVCFGLIFGKLVFGGVGMNIFNPALVGFCALYVSFSAEMSQWPSDYMNLSTTVSRIFPWLSSSFPVIDIHTGATALASLKANGIFAQIATDNYSYWLINGAWLLGGCYLWFRNIADWRLSFSFMTSFIAFTLVFNYFNESYISTIQHIGLGALIFTGCFIITDPTSAATSTLGRVIYALLAALLAVIIRQYSNMPDSMAFAVLLANMSAPMIDSYTRPQYFKAP